MIHLLAIIALALAVIFFGFHLAHGVWSWEFLALWGLLLWCISGHEKWPY